MLKRYPAHEVIALGHVRKDHLGEMGGCAGDFRVGQGYDTGDGAFLPSI